MPMVGLALTAMISFGFAPPDAADTDVIVVAPAPPPAPAPAPPPAPTVPAWGPAADVSSSQPARPVAPPPAPPPPAAPVVPRRPMAGIGLMISSAVVFGVGFANRLGQIDSAVANCGSWSRLGYANVTHCFDSYDSPGADSNDLFVGFAYGSSMVLSMIGTGTLGDRAAWNTVYGDGRVRNPNARYVFGAIMTGLGVAAIAGHYALIYTDAEHPCTDWECNVQRRALWVAASDGGAMLLNVGFASFSWANHYRRSVRRYGGPRFAVLPSATPGSVGATVSARF